jgi:hypothetical protein
LPNTHYVCEGFPRRARASDGGAPLHGARGGPAAKGANTSTPQIQSFIAPNHYQLSGGGISITYLPVGAGGLAHLLYQDTQRTLNFTGDQIRSVEVPDLGTVVSVTLMITVDSGSTTFSMLIPKVTLQNTTGASAHIHSEGITTVHRFSLVPMFDLGQDELYTVTAMRGTASSVIIPL